MTPPRKYKDAGLAMIIAKRFWIEGLDLEDLYQEACYAMVRAEPSWDPSKGTRSTLLSSAARNHLIGLLAATRMKKRHCPTGDVLSLNTESDLVDEQELGDRLVARDDTALLAEQHDLITRALQHPSLTTAERACLHANAIGGTDHDAGYTHATGGSARRKLRDHEVAA